MTTAAGDAMRGKSCVVTGGSRGIGRSIALALAARGADLTLPGRDVEELAATAGAALDAGAAGARPLEMDLASEADVRDAAARIERADVLVNSAGVIEIADVTDARMDDWDRLYATNVRGPYLLIQLLLPLLRMGGGQVVFINSSQAINARRRYGQYAATKHAERAIANSLRDEVNEQGVRVTSLYLGRTATPRIEAEYAAHGEEYRPELLLQPEDVAAAVVFALTLPGTAEITDLHLRPMKKSY